MVELVTAKTVDSTVFATGNLLIYLTKNVNISPLKSMRLSKPTTSEKLGLISPFSSFERREALQMPLEREFSDRLCNKRSSLMILPIV